MHKQWIGCYASNFLAGRAGYAPEAIVLHRTDGVLAAIDGRHAKPRTYNSVHYAVGIAGEVHQYIEEKDTAFHAGIVVNPVWKLVKPAVNPNLYTIGIELEKQIPGKALDIQNQSLAALILEIATRWKLPLDSDHIVLHEEIRAGAGCPGSGFDRSSLLAFLASNRKALSPQTEHEDDILVLKDSNVRERPVSSARIVRVARAGTAETVLGFEDSGERIQGNATWYHTGDGNYLWAGLTDKPNPVRTFLAPPAIPSVAPSPMPVFTGIPSIDDLFNQSPGPPIGEGVDTAAIGAIQDLLTGHGSSGLPTMLSTNYGAWNAKTLTAIQAFESESSLPVTGKVDTRVLQQMIEKPAIDPRASRAYLTLVLRYPFTGLHKVLGLVAQMEGAGKFGAFNRNTDRAGASFGLIQWAQKPGRLAEILQAMSTADREQFVAIFGAGDPHVADGLLAHCRKPSGGIDPKTGDTTSPTFNLIDEPWITRFRQAATALPFQKVQVEAAVSAFGKSCSLIRHYAPGLTSERAMSFMLDVANQFGDGGAKALYTRVYKDGMHEPDILEAVADASVASIADSLKAGVRARRDRFLETPFLSGKETFSL